MPVTVDNISDHKMHSEWGEIGVQTAAAINADASVNADESVAVCAEKTCKRRVAHTVLKVASGGS